MPSARSARTPPMPRMISCCRRVSRSPPYRRAERSRSCGAFSSRPVSSRYSADAADRHFPDVGQHGAVAERHRDDAWRSVRLQRLLDGDVGPVEPLVHLELPAFGRNRLMEISLGVHEPDADQRHAEVARFLAVIAGEHAEAARINRQRLVNRELGREIRDRRVLQIGKAPRHPRVLRGVSRVEPFDGVRRTF